MDEIFDVKSEKGTFQIFSKCWTSMRLATDYMRNFPVSFFVLPFPTSAIKIAPSFSEKWHKIRKWNLKIVDVLPLLTYRNIQLSVGTFFSHILYFLALKNKLVGKNIEKRGRESNPPVRCDKNVVIYN